VRALRAGNFLNEAFAIFPPVEDQDRWKHGFYRVLGVGCLTVSVYFFRHILYSLILPVMRGLR
jgi:hypothetical protein